MERRIKTVEFPALPKLQIKRVAAYARVSSGKDAMLHSLSAQVSYYSSYIQSHPGWIYCGVYSDEAITGTKAQRAGFQGLMTACKNGEIDMVITKSISRLSRNTITLLNTVRELKQMGVDVYFEEQNIHTLSSDGELLLTILASYAQEESLSASENAKWRIRKGFENGELINWRFLYGYSINKSGVSVNEDEARVVRLIFDRFLSGDSLSSISSHLNKSGIKSTLNGRWTPQQLRRILSNEKYTGSALLQKTFRNNHIEKQIMPNNGEYPKYYAEDTHTAIIDQATYEKALKLLENISDKTASRPKPTRSVLSGKIICGQCGTTYKRGKCHQNFIWNCSSYIFHGKSTCPGLQIREEVLLRAIADTFGHADFDPDFFLTNIDTIRVGKNHELIIHLKDGTAQRAIWHTPSRANSWSPEMRALASQKTREQRRKQNAKENSVSNSNPGDDKSGYSAGNSRT